MKIEPNYDAAIVETENGFLITFHNPPSLDSAKAVYSLLENPLIGLLYGPENPTGRSQQEIEELAISAVGDNRQSIHIGINPTYESSRVIMPLVAELQQLGLTIRVIWMPDHSSPFSKSECFTGCKSN